MKNIILSPIELDDLLSLFKTIIDEQLKKLQPLTPEIPLELPERPTRQQVAKHLNVSLVTLNKWSKAGILQSYKIGESNQVRYKREEVVKAFIQVKNLKYKR